MSFNFTAFVMPNSGILSDAYHANRDRVEFLEFGRVQVDGRVVGNINWDPDARQWRASPSLATFLGCSALDKIAESRSEHRMHIALTENLPAQASA